jgi:succinate-semialdehyde dehydrogenase/glutarate-semialdehyde dehydrogenase
VAAQIQSARVFINHPVWIYEDMPFGGIKKSGCGRELGPLGNQEFVNQKLVPVL